MFVWRWNEDEYSYNLHKIHNAGFHFLLRLSYRQWWQQFFEVECYMVNYTVPHGDQYGVAITFYHRPSDKSVSSAIAKVSEAAGLFLCCDRSTPLQLDVRTRTAVHQIRLTNERNSTSHHASFNHACIKGSMQCWGWSCYVGQVTVHQPSRGKKGFIRNARGRVRGVRILCPNWPAYC